jgi:hypothetical protein
MIIIAHRGNLNGPIPERENKPDYILEAIDAGFDVEVDVWYTDDGLFLGHDGPEVKIDHQFLQNPKLWCHAKNVRALQYMLDIGDIICFFHDTDEVTLTSNGYIWTYPGKALHPRSICIHPEFNKANLTGCSGACTDYAEEYTALYHAK